MFSAPGDLIYSFGLFVCITVMLIDVNVDNSLMHVQLSAYLIYFKKIA